jgi:protein SCO1/2
MFAAVFLITAGAGLSLDSGCAPANPTRETDHSTTKDYLLKGVVTKVEQDSGHVRIRHEEIPDFMPAMTMRFSLKDRNLLAELKERDEVEGTLHVLLRDGAVSDYELRSLVVTKPAPKETMIVDIAKGQVRPAPRLLEMGDQIPDFAMTMQDGNLFKLSQLRGKVVVLTFIYTRCPLPDFCPLMDRKFSALSQSIAAFPERAKHIRLISLSFDPEHDTPEVLRKHALIRGATPPLWSYAVAHHEELAKVAPGLGLFYGPGQGEVAHNLVSAVIDPEGKLARIEVGRERNRWETADLLKTVYSLIPSSGR